MMSAPCGTIPNMNLELERLVTFKTAATTTRAQIDYVDLLANHAYRLTTRPGDLDRTATALDELVSEIASHRTGQNP